MIPKSLNGETVAIRCFEPSREGELLPHANPVEPIRARCFSWQAEASRCPALFQADSAIQSGRPSSNLSPKWAGSCLGAPNRAVDRFIEAKPATGRRRWLPSGPAPKYRWGLNHRFYPYRDFGEEGQRVEMVFTNPTPMGHHLHGHEFQILQRGSSRCATGLCAHRRPLPHCL